jgi:hypothetical protein
MLVLGIILLVIFVPIMIASAILAGKKAGEE